MFLKSQMIQQAELLGQWKDASILSSFQYDNTYNEVWGIAINNSEFAIIGSTEGTHFIDVTDPRNVVESFFVAGAVTTQEIIHRDYHDYNGYLYAVADEGTNSTLQIIDISQLPVSVQVVYDDNTILNRTHNIFIDESAGLMYGCISRGSDPLYPYVPLRIFDISDPLNPTVINSINAIDGVQFSQVHDAYVRDGIAYLNCGPSGFAVAKFNDPLNPTLLGTLFPNEYDQSGYNHSGWLDVAGDHYYMADENYEKDIKVVDVGALPDITVVDTIDAGSTSPLTIPHNQVVAGNFLYSSYYYDGLQVYDISNPAKPVRVMEYSTSSRPHNNSYEGAWGVYPLLPSGNILISDMQEGLFVVKGCPECFTSLSHSTNCGLQTLETQAIKYESDNWIQTSSNTVIENGAEVKYKAADFIELNYPFEVKIGADFEAIIGNCGSRP